MMVAAVGNGIIEGSTDKIFPLGFSRDERR